MTTGYTTQYFADRYPEQKDFAMFSEWLDLINPKTILCFGDGVGKHTYIGNYYGYPTTGYDPFIPEEQIIPEIKSFFSKQIPGQIFDLVICNDVLEHIRPEETDKLIAELVAKVSLNGYLLLSICDASLWDVYKDPTHINKHTRAWWEWQFTKLGLKQIQVPKKWLFAHQLYLFQKVN